MINNQNQRADNPLIDQIFAALIRHRERYLRAYCAKYGIDNIDALDHLEMVEQTDFSQPGKITTKIWIREKARS